MSSLSADEFVSAARHGNIEAVREAIEGGQDVNVHVKDWGGNTALILASHYGHTDTVSELLSRGATVDLANNAGYSALIDASRYGHTDIVSELLSNGATVDLTNNYGETALMKARKSTRSNPETLSLLEEAERNASVTHHQTNQDSPVPVQTETTPDKQLTEPLSHTPGTEQLSHTPGTEPLSHTPGTEPLSHTPGTEQLSHTPGTEPLSHTLGTEPLSHTLSTEPLSHTPGTEPLSHTLGTEPLSHTPGTEPLSHTPGTEQLSHTPGTEPLSHTLGTEPLSHTPGTEPLSHTPGTEPLSHTLGTEPLSHTLSTEPLSHTPGTEPLSHTPGTEPLSHTPGTEPLSHTLSTEPLSHTPGTEQLSHTLGTEPLSQTVESKHSSPPGHPLIQTPYFPEVTFFGEPQEKVLSQQGPRAKFDNGVEVTVSPHTLPPKSTASVTVHPGFASKDIFVMPQDVHSASPAYLIGMSGSEVTGEVTITLQHHVNVKTQEEADNLCFLQADTSPSRSGSYKYTQPTDSRSEFKPGENRGTLTTRRFSKKFFKVCLKKIKKWFKGVPNEPSSSSPDPHLYTVRMYRSPPQTTGDKIAVIGISLYGQLYSKFLDDLPGLYPEVSSKPVDRTDSDPVGFEELHAKLEILSVQGWRVEPDKLTISKRGVELPEMNNFKLEELQIDNYPPRIVCRFYPDGRPPKRTTCTLSITGFDDEVKVHVPLKAPKAATVDTTKLQEAAVKLKSTAVSVKETELGSTVATILTLMDSITTALLSSSLTDLAAQTDSIKKEVKTVLKVSRKVTEKCSVQTIKDNIEVSLSKTDVLSHQLCQVAKVKLNYCQDLPDETTALSDLVSNAAGLLTAIDSLLKNISFTNTTPAYNALKVCGGMVVEGLTLDPKTIALSLFSAEFISETTLHETNDLNEIRRDKGRRLYEAVLGTVKSHSHKYHQFTAILRKDELLHKDLLLALEQAYK